MKTSELTDRALLQWLDEEISRRIQSLASLEADRSWRVPTDYEMGEQNARYAGYGQQRQTLETLRNNLRLGLRCIDGELPQLGDRPWSEQDADHDGNELTPVALYV